MLRWSQFLYGFVVHYCPWLRNIISSDVQLYAVEGQKQVAFRSLVRSVVTVFLCSKRERHLFVQYVVADCIRNQNAVGLSKFTFIILYVFCFCFF